MPIHEGLSACGSAACQRPAGEALRVPEASLLRVEPGSRVGTPLCRLADRLAGLSGWRRYGLAFLLGACGTATLPPVDLTPFLFIAFPGLLWLDDGSNGPWASFRLGYAFGLGFFLSGLYWIAAALLVDIRFWWLVPIAVPGFICALHRLGAARHSPQCQKISIAGCGAGDCFRRYLVSGRMASWACLHRPSVEFDRLRLVRRLPGRDPDAANCGLGRRLRTELPNRSCRFVAEPPRLSVAVE